MEISKELINELKKQLRKEIMRELGKEKKGLTGKQKKMIAEAFNQNSAISIDLYGKLQFGESDFYCTMYVIFAKDCKNPEMMQLEVLKKLDEVQNLHSIVEFI